MRALRTIDGFLRRAASRPCVRALLALALSLALLLAACLIETPTYYENDDSNIAFALAGYRSGEPYPTHPFINCILGFAVSGLYRLIPAVPWWTVCQLVAILLSMTAVCASALKLAYRRRAPMLSVLAGFCVWYAGLMFYATALLTFTLTSAAAGTAAMALVLSDEADDAPRLRAGRDVLSCLFLALSFLFRNSGGISMLCFYAGALVFRLFRALAIKTPGKRKVLLRTGALGVSALALSALLIAVNAYGLRACNEEGFTEFDHYRSMFLDYPHDTYAENPALYASVGWDETLYSMMDKWYFMDGRINADTLRAIYEGSAPHTVTAAGALEQIGQVLTRQEPAAYQAAMPVLALLLALALYLRRRKEPLPLLFALAMFFGMCILALYLCLQSRFLLRTLQLLAIPAAAAILLLCLRLLPETAETEPAGGRGTAVLTWVLALALLVPAYKSARVVAGYDSSALLDESRAVISYAMAHPENVYIRDTYVGNNYDAWTVYPDAKPVNLMDWGGTSTMTGFWALQLQANGIEPFTAEAFLGERVYYIGNADGPEKAAFEAYLAAVLGARLETVEQITDSAAVYRVAAGA